jgi:hypothetical protein
MIKIRFAVAAAAAALALGTASAVAMQEAATGADSDNHGATVSSAARTTCPHGPNGVHGQCVSAIASTNGQAHRNGAGAAHVKNCKDAGLTGREFGACVAGTTHAAPKS